MIWPAGSSVLLGPYHQKNVKDSQERAWVYKKDSASPVMNMCFDIIHWTLDAKRVIEKKQGWKGTTQSFAGLRRSQWVLSDYKFNNLSIGLVYWHYSLDCVKKKQGWQERKSNNPKPLGAPQGTNRRCTSLQKGRLEFTKGPPVPGRKLDQSQQPWRSHRFPTARDFIDFLRFFVFWTLARIYVPFIFKIGTKKSNHR